MNQDVVVLPQRLLVIASLHLHYLNLLFYVPRSDLQQESATRVVRPFAQGDFHVSLALVLDALVLEQELPPRCY